MSVCVWLAVCARQFECVRLWSESEWAISLAALLPPPSLSLSLSLCLSEGKPELWTAVEMSSAVQ